MAYRLLLGGMLMAGGIAAAAAADDAAKEPVGPAVHYVVGAAPAGMAEAAIVKGLPLVYTRQLLGLDADGKLVAPQADKQIEQALANLAAVLKAAGSGLDKLVRLHVYAIKAEDAEQVREQLARRLPPGVRPAISVVLTTLPHPKAVVGVDAVAAAEAGKTKALALGRAEGVYGEKDRADYAVLPPGGVAYLSGVPEEGSVGVSATARSMAVLMRTLERLKIAPKQVVQLKVFLRPATAAEEAIAEMKKLFAGQSLPPVVFVEWIASVPIEIELIAELPPAAGAAPPLEFFTPPDVRPSPDFSRVALVRTDRQVFISGLLAAAPGNPEAQARDVFARLKSIVERTGGDMAHLAKATYYVADDDASGRLNKVRSEYLDPSRPPAASKVTVHGVGKQRSLSLDMIAVGAGK